MGVGGLLGGFRVAWPSADWGSLPLEGGIQVGFQRQLSNSENFAAELELLEKKLNAVRSPIRTAENFGIMEIIDPRTLRAKICDWIGIVYDNVLPGLLRRSCKL
eukprot:TRINITY_DN13523_c0_g1_i3.p1 TRINITY_DN13523_c0_g1~~TRINITY_DN13523_c0_g1_i3.p1  ORF type:complete len:104 (+),score=13.51 TRINITY_DN13523_c0_g1_i3:162-473(+)